MKTTNNKQRKRFLLTNINFQILCILFLASAFSANAQTNADAVIEKASQQYIQSGGMNVVFSANIRSDKNGVSESFEGTISMKEDKFVLKTPDMTTWYDGKTQWTYMPRTKEVNVSTPSGSDLQFLNPMIVLQNYKKDFNVSYIGESTSANAKSAVDVALVPKKKDDIEKIEVQIEKNTSLPSRIVVIMRNDTRATVQISKIQSGMNLPDETFVFPENKYPNIEIIDLR